MSRRVKVSKLKEAIRHLVLRELNEQDNKPEHFGGGENIDILGFQTKHFDICKSAVILYNKLMEKDLSDEAKELVVSSAKEMDHIFEMEKQVVNGEEVDHDPVEHGIELTNIISFQLGRVAEMIGEDFERDTNFIKMHVMEIVKRHKREVDEVSTTGTAGTYPGGPGHYFTPYAFSGGRKKDKKKKKKITHAGGYKPVNEGYGEMMDELEKIYRPSGAPPIVKQALKDLADEYDIGRVLYAARTNEKSFREVLDMKIDQLQSQYVNKKHINTIKRGKNLKEALNDKGVKEFKRELALDVKYVKALSKLINKKSVGKATEKDDQVISSLTNLLQGRFSGLANLLKIKSLNEGRYHDWRNDESLTPKQKIGRSIREVRDSLNELDKTIKMNLKLKNELKVDSRDYWKNTHKALGKISERLVKLAGKVGNLK